MEAGTCWMQLGQPERAVEAFSPAHDGWPEELRRDRSLALARLASAQAAVGDVNEACRTSVEALQLMRASSSGRALRELRGVRSRLMGWARRPDIDAISQAIATLVAAA